MLLKCCTLHASKFGKLNSGQSLEKVSFHPNEKAMPKKGNAKECSSYCTIALISHASKVMLKILQARLHQLVNFQMYKMNLERVEEREELDLSSATC